MASWKVALYGSVTIALIIVLIILNFDYLPNRKRDEDMILSRNSQIGVEVATNFPTTTATPKEEELTLKDFKTKTWNCSGLNTSSVHTQVNKSRSICYNEKIDPLMCFTDPVHCKQKLTNYDTRPVHWPKYGEYTYLPKSKWKYVIVHGGVLFLYHPCASNELIKKIKDMAGSCLHRHVITPYENLDPSQEFAVVAWGCIYSASHFNSTALRLWIRSNAMKAPAVHVVRKGGSGEGLVDPARIVSDRHESELCPSEQSMYEHSMDNTNKMMKKQDDSQPSNTPQKFEEHVSIKASERIVIVRGQDGKLRERHKFDSVNAAWALGSLLFLSAILVSVMLYVKPWRQRDYYWWRSDDLTYDSNSKFSFLKSKKMLGRWRSSKRSPSSAHAKLLGPIPEEMDDDL